MQTQPWLAESAILNVLNGLPIKSFDMPLTNQDLIKAIEESTVTHRCDDGWDHNLVDADILLAELKKMEE